MKIPALLAAAMLFGCAPPPPAIPCGGKTCGGNQYCIYVTPRIPGVPPLPGSPQPSGQNECADAPPANVGGADCDAPKGHDVVCHSPPEPSAPPHP